MADTRSPATTASPEPIHQFDIRFASKEKIQGGLTVGGQSPSSTRTSSVTNIIL